MILLDLAIADQEARRLWEALADLSPRLPGRWVLIGGLMVQLHAMEHGITAVRPTRDIDVLGEARPQGSLAAIDRALRSDGFELVAPDLDGFAHRYQRGDLVVDVLAPDGIEPPPALGGVKAVGVPGGTQALNRSELIAVTVNGSTFELRRPTLLGAILIKARSLTRHASPAAQREDLLRLLALVEDPRVIAAELKATERNWLRRAERRLDFDAPSQLSPNDARNARLAYRILIRNQ